MGVNNTKELNRLLKKYKCCYWCGCKVIKSPDHRTLDEAFKQTPNTATVDHLYPKTDIRRYINSQKFINIKRRFCRNRIVLSCYRCNQDRNNKDWITKHQSDYFCNYPIFDIRELLTHMTTDYFLEYYTDLEPVKPLTLPPQPQQSPAHTPYSTA